MLHPSQIEITTARIDDELMARDTTCVNTIDKEGIMFSATPSGAWLPSVIAGDTGIPLTERAQSFLLSPGHPNELAGGKRPRVTLSPTLVTLDGKAGHHGRHSRRRQSGPVHSAATAERDRFSYECAIGARGPALPDAAPGVELRQSCDEPRRSAAGRPHSLSCFTELTDRGHRTATRTKWGSGAAPVMIRVLPDGVIEAGADPFGYRVSNAW
jgi:Gamma-glutamyltransferase